jgi:hypothetical protein
MNAPNSNLIRYEGLLNSEVRVQLTDLLMAIALTNLGSRGDLKKLFGVAVELLDNAQRYCSAGSVSFQWRIQGPELVIEISNLADKADAERLLSSEQPVHERVLVEHLQVVKACPRPTCRGT